LAVRIEFPAAPSSPGRKESREKDVATLGVDADSRVKFAERSALQFNERIQSLRGLSSRSPLRLLSRTLQDRGFTRRKLETGASIVDAVIVIDVSQISSAGARLK